MKKLFNKEITKEFAFSHGTTFVVNRKSLFQRFYQWMMRVITPSRETYVFIANVSICIDAKDVGDGQQAGFSYFVKINKIHKYQVDKSSFDLVDLDSMLETCGKNNPNLRREIVESIAQEALGQIPMFQKHSIADVLAHATLEDSADSGRKI